MIFIDSSFLLALLLKSDINHNKALELGDNFHENKMINTTVLTETLNAFNAVGGKTGFSLYENLKRMFEIDYLTINDYDESINIYLNYDSSINYSDCTILRSMKKNNIFKIATFDSHFKKVNGIEVIC